MSVEKIANQTIEKHCLAGFIKNPKKLLELLHIVSEEDFLFAPHGKIFSILRDNALNNKASDPVLVAERLQNLKITHKGNLDILNYLESLTYIKISDRALEDACKKLKTLSIRREIYETARLMAQAMSGAGDLSADEVIAKADKIYGDKISAYGLTHEPEDLFEDIISMVEANAANPIEELGIPTPFHAFNDLYGGLMGGEIYAWCSRPKQGKSTILNYIGYKSSLLVPNCKTLVLDTEMQTEKMKYRIASALSGVPVWWLRTGKYAKNRELLAKFEASKEAIREAIGHVSHLEVSGKPIDDVTSIIQRWYLSQVGRGNPAILVYDYIKITGESDYNKKEYELVGEKVNKLKECVLRLNIPLLTACQLNRSAENGTDDSSAIAMSDRLLMFGSLVGIFRRKNIEEIAEDGPEFGTHKFIELATRDQGRNARGHNNLVRTVDDRGRVVYRNNFINYRVENFSVTECGTLEDIIRGRDVEVNVFEQENANANEPNNEPQPQENNDRLL